MENEQTNLAPKLPDQILIERITYLASLVSNLQAVDSKLDTLRVITARVGAGNQISLGESERSQLLVLENDLKNYLVTSDPVRSFTAEKLQRRLEKYTETRNPQARAAKIALREDGLATPVFHDGLGDASRIEKYLCVELGERHSRLRHLWLRQLHVDTATALVLHAMDRATVPDVGLCTTAQARMESTQLLG